MPYKFKTGLREVFTLDRWAYFMSKVELAGDSWEDDCWEWTGYTNGHGYGQLGIRPHGRFQVHRLSLAWSSGQSLDDSVVDHLCRNTVCVNPNHLEAVTQKENLARGETINRRNASRTHCPQGHEYTPDNTYVNPNTSKYGGSRKCRTCMRARDRLRRKVRS